MRIEIKFVYAHLFEVQYAQGENWQKNLTLESRKTSPNDFPRRVGVSAQNGYFGANASSKKKTFKL